MAFFKNPFKKDKNQEKPQIINERDIFVEGYFSGSFQIPTRLGNTDWGIDAIGKDEHVYAVSPNKITKPMQIKLGSGKTLDILPGQRIIAKDVDNSLSVISEQELENNYLLYGVVSTEGSFEIKRLAECEQILRDKYKIEKEDNIAESANEQLHNIKRERYESLETEKEVYEYVKARTNAEQDAKALGVKFVRTEDLRLGEDEVYNPHIVGCLIEEFNNPSSVKSFTEIAKLKNEIDAITNPKDIKRQTCIDECLSKSEDYQKLSKAYKRMGEIANGLESHHLYVFNEYYKNGTGVIALFENLELNQARAARVKNFLASSSHKKAEKTFKEKYPGQSEQAIYNQIRGNYERNSDLNRQM